MYFYVYHIHHASGLSYVGSRSCKCDPQNDTRYWGSGTYIKEARSKFPDGWTKTIIDTYPTHEIMRKAEDAFIWLFFGAEGNLNIKPKSSGCRGWRMSEQGRANCKAAAKLRKPMSAEGRAKQSAALKGRKQTPEHIAARTAALAKSEKRHELYRKWSAGGNAAKAARRAAQSTLP